MFFFYFFFLICFRNKIKTKSANSATWSAAGDIDALITVEVLLVAPDATGGEQLHIANIQFNNLDIIGKICNVHNTQNIIFTQISIRLANQETIVELLGFAKRVFPKHETTPLQRPQEDLNESNDGEADANSLGTVPIRTEITFDFHRLNVLVLRALVRDSFMVGRKVGTFTMSEARIHATVGKTITVEGSLGGLQILDLTPEGVAHQRILSVGKDPLTDPPHIEQDLLSSLTQEIYAMGHNKIEDSNVGRQALSFRITRNLNACVDIKIRMGSVWYTHCARFMQELSWCATEFKHYLK